MSDKNDESKTTSVEEDWSIEFRLRFWSVNQLEEELALGLSLLVTNRPDLKHYPNAFTHTLLLRALVSGSRESLEHMLDRMRKIFQPLLQEEGEALVVRDDLSDSFRVTFRSESGVPDDIRSKLSGILRLFYPTDILPDLGKVGFRYIPERTDMAAIVASALFVANNFDKFKEQFQSESFTIPSWSSGSIKELTKDPVLGVGRSCIPFPARDTFLRLARDLNMP